MPATIIAFPRQPSRSRASDAPRLSGVRIAYVPAWWCVETLKDGWITQRNRMPSKADAERIARRIAARDKLTLLPPAEAQTFGNHSPDAA